MYIGVSVRRLGVYPNVSFSRACEIWRDYEELLSRNIDPKAHREELKNSLTRACLVVLCGLIAPARSVAGLCYRKYLNRLGWLVALSCGL